MKFLYKNKDTENKIKNIDSVKEWSKPIKKSLYKILMYLDAANNFKEMLNPKRFGLHHLYSNRVDEWAMKIDVNYRLTFSLCDDDGNVITDKDCVNIASTIKILLIKEVSNHYAK
ncbi:type II toxin-antitoxin system RelE/ParE family toxin [bacterium]|nr:type II toxin-antitoxin system RelE/ParE family toxin [bacterium]